MGGQQFLDLVDLHQGQARKHVGEIFFRIEATSPAANQDRVNHRAAPSGLEVANKQPSSPTHGDPTNYSGTPDPRRHSNHLRMDFTLPDTRAVQQPILDEKRTTISHPWCASGLKWVLDGTPLERGAALRTGYADKPNWQGQLDLSSGRLKSVVQRAWSSGDQKSKLFRQRSCTETPVHCKKAAQLFQMTIPRIIFYIKEILPPRHQSNMLFRTMRASVRGPFRSNHRNFGFFRNAAVFLFVFLLAATPAATSGQNAAREEHGLGPIRSYISSGWDSLTRSMTDCKTIVDPKLTTVSVLYVPADLEAPAAVQQLQKRCNVQIRHLPKVIHQLGEIDPERIGPGLLYLENKYVVPGGRFNEMYGWDSYFIIRGLVRDNRVELARGIVENFFFEIEHYGAVLNANRAYYLTRSQPPFLTSMILEVYNAQRIAGHEDRTWLARAYNYATRDYGLWTREPHLAGSTGLSRYYDFGNGPAPESLKDETGHYRQVAAFFLAQPDLARNYLVPSNQVTRTFGPTFALQVCDTAKTMTRPKCDAAGTVALSADYYKGDRAMRESGYDISFRFGPYGAASHHYAPVCLNSLLYKTERDLEQMSEMLGQKSEADEWARRAEDRKTQVQKYLWDAQRGLYFDYDFENNARSSYEYVTTFYPMWVGIATPEQAQAIMKNLAIFEKPGGLVMSTQETGGQWDFPYAWAPDQLLGDEGIRRYGFKADADRLSYEFLSTVAENFRRDGTIREKYNAVTRSSETAVKAGYNINVVGFGWSNAAVTVFLHQMPAELVEKLAREQAAVAAK